MNPRWLSGVSVARHHAMLINYEHAIDPTFASANWSITLVLSYVTEWLNTVSDFTLL